MAKMGRPFLAVVRFSSEDVIATSYYYIPKSMYSGEITQVLTYTPSDTDWILCEGAMGAYNDQVGGNIVTLSGPPYYQYSNDSVISYQGGVAYQPHEEDKSTYEVFAVQDGYYYTKGASYWELYGGQ